MKRNYLIITAILLLLVGCSKSEPTTSSYPEGYTPSSQAMVFSTQSDDNNTLATRGALVGEFVSGDQMGVYAYYTPYGEVDTSSPNFMNNQAVTKTDLSWSYSPVKYWSDNVADTFVFQAYAPYATTINGIAPNSTDGAIALGYSMPQECEAQPDLMISAPMQIIDQDVSFYLYHTLATLSFAVKGDPSQSIVAISVSGIADRGTVVWDTALNAPKWYDTTSTGATYSATIDPTITPSDESTQITTSQGYLMVIPQTIPTQGFEVSVEIAKAEESATVTRTLTIAPTDDVTEWVVNKNYMYTITLTE